MQAAEEKTTSEDGEARCRSKRKTTRKEKKRKQNWIEREPAASPVACAMCAMGSIAYVCARR